MISPATTQFSITPDPLSPASTPSDYGEHRQVQTGSTNNLATETDVDAISMAIPTCMFIECTFFTGLYARSPGNNYNFATENDINVISGAAAMFSG